tara:strand:+ start:161 stop:745 length:585 start_codon:yes stop_codon:yes gene_type:complete
MAKQSVNLGSSANDGTGDPLRTAFDKINDNFDELYLYSTATADNNITITGNTIATDNTNGNITIDPNGTGRLIIATGAEIRVTDHVDNGIVFSDTNGDLSFSGALTFDGSTLATTGSLTVNNRLRIQGNVISSMTTNDDIDIDPSGTGKINYITTQQATVGAAGSAANVPAKPTTYFQIKVNGVNYVVPAFAVS